MYDLQEKDFGLLLLILKMCDDIKLYQEEYKITQLLENRMSINAILMNIMQIGENANRLSRDFLEHFDKIYWLEIINIRHRITHDYGGIDLAIIEDAVRTHLDILIDKTFAILKEFQRDELYTELINDESFDTNFQSREILQRVDTLRASVG